MYVAEHKMVTLFSQLGLPAELSDIEHFISAHAPLPSDMELSAAPFWTDSQSCFLREEILDDADWAEVIDELNVCLHL